jgi:D-amino-acid dehydrogenase
MTFVVVGGGVVGLWCARELLAAGAKVTVLANTPGEAAVSTPASAGWVVPVLSSPLSSPGIVVRSLHQLARREAAFSVVPAASPGLARWLWAFVRSGSTPRYRAGLRATLELAGSCVDQYVALRDSGLPVELYRDGLLMVARTPAGLHEAAGLVEGAAAAGYDGKYDVLDRDRLLDLQPVLASSVRGGVHARDELHVQPEGLLSALRQDVLA